MKALLSIKPEFVEKIFAGEKQFEYRKVAFSRNVSKVIIYATSPVCRIVGEFDVDRVIEMSPEALWEQTHNESGVSKNFFFQYFAGRTKGIAIKIVNLKRYKKAVNPYIEVGFVAPQSFRYICD